MVAKGMTMRGMTRAALIAALAAGSASAREPGRYGPIGGLFSGSGFDHKVRADGSWVVDASSRAADGPGFALNMAMYRAAELAHEQGFAYVQFLSGSASERRLTHSESARVVVRPSHSPAAPTGCKPGRCYTADVAHLMRLLGGPGGNQPGTAFPTRVDEYGRAVTITGFGLAQAASGSDAIPDPRAVPVPRPISGPGSDAWLRLGAR